MKKEPTRPGRSGITVGSCVVLAMLLIFVSPAVQAQMTFSILGGMTLNSLVYFQTIDFPQDNPNPSISRVGLCLDLGVGFQLDKASQIEILLYARNVFYSVTPLPNPLPMTPTVLLSYYVSSGLLLDRVLYQIGYFSVIAGAGFVADFLIDSIDMNGTQSVKSMMNSILLNGVLKLSFVLKPFIIEVRYSIGLGPISSNPEYVLQENLSTYTILTGIVL